MGYDHDQLPKSTTPSLVTYQQSLPPLKIEYIYYIYHYASTKERLIHPRVSIMAFFTWLFQGKQKLGKPFRCINREQTA